MARPRHANHVDLWHRRLEVGFLFRTLSLIDDMAKRTRMSAIKCLSNRLAQRGAFRVIDEHRCPGQRLERDPLQAGGAAKRDDCNNATDLSKHDCEASDQPDLGQANDVRTSRYDVTCLASRKLRTKSNRVSSRAAKTARDLPQGDRSRFDTVCDQLPMGEIPRRASPASG